MHAVWAGRLSPHGTNGRPVASGAVYAMPLLRSQADDLDESARLQTGSAD